MGVYTSEKIRNVALIGHSGCGKTSLMELALLETGVINRVGTIEDGNTVSDFDPDEIKKGFSLSTSIIPIDKSSCALDGFPLDISSFKFCALISANCFSNSLFNVCNSSFEIKGLFSFSSPQ